MEIEGAPKISFITRNSLANKAFFYGAVDSSCYRSRSVTIKSLDTTSTKISATTQATHRLPKPRDQSQSFRSTTNFLSLKPGVARPSPDPFFSKFKLYGHEPSLYDLPDTAKNQNQNQNSKIQIKNLSPGRRSVPEIFQPNQLERSSSRQRIFKPQKTPVFTRKNSLDILAQKVTQPKSFKALFMESRTAKGQNFLIGESSR